MGTGTIFRRHVALPAMLLGPLALLSASPAAALRFDWTTEEKACAATIGIDLDRDATTRSAAFIETLAWNSDLVVVGSVTEVRTDEGAGYPTLATIEVSDVRKGEVGGKTIVLCLGSGPQRTDPDGTTISIFVGGEPTVAVGERLVLFLTTTAYRIPEENPTRYVLLPGQYRWFHDYKFIVRDDRVTLPPYDDWSMALEELLRRVDVSARVQAGRCEPTPER